FVAFAPYDAPKVAVAVVVEHGGGGSSAAAPIVRDIALRALYGTVPPLTAYPDSQRRGIEDLFNSMDLRDPDSPSGGRSRA
ncbi:MAG: penicillin-binding transpeptidase domain-containing protein, partial [Paracoccaceae bacterium]